MSTHLKLVSFNPNPELSPSSNLKNFIAYCRNNLTVFTHAPDYSWDAYYWRDVNKDNSRLRFTKQEHANVHPAAVPTTEQLMDTEMQDICKAYLSYRHTISPHKNAARELQAFRALDKALRSDVNGKASIAELTESHFLEATKSLQDIAARQNIVLALLQILKLLSEKLIVPAEVVRWTNPFVKQASYHALRGANAPAEVKAEKLADQDALLSIADVFSQSLSQLDDSDIMVTSLTALLLSAPMRIGETLRWRTDCLRSDTDSQGTLQRYLAYYVPKTRSYTRKAVPTTMAEVAQEAVDRLTSITDEGRRLARYLETNPAKFYRHDNCPDVPDDQVLTPNQVAQALGYMHAGACEDFLRKYTGTYTLTGFTLNSLWQIVLAEHSKLNPHFPYQEKPDGELKPLKMSESLMCFRKLQLGVRVSTSPVLLAPFKADHYRKRLDGTIKADRKNQRPLCFFTKHGYDPIALNPHSLRHFVNELARQHGVTVDVITEWSSRASQTQTRTYLHETAEQKRERTSSLMGTKQEHETLTPVTQVEAHAYGHGPFHRSRYGICRRSWGAGPCIKFADCTNCSELLACKGDKIALAAVKNDRDHMVKTWEAAKRAVDAGERSASLWMQKATPQIQRLAELISIMENPAIPDGSPIQMIGTDFSHEALIVEEKAKEAGVQLLDKEQLALEYGDDLVELLEMLV
ncbi:integrase [Pseudomonas sp. X4]|uniref:integrase n=1 Tax=Pseudomonas sp. X4 TaxID=3231526 RepID=UPI003460A64F